MIIYDGLDSLKVLVNKQFCLRRINDSSASFEEMRETFQVFSLLKYRLFLPSNQQMFTALVDG